MNCKNCHQELIKETNFCSKCGHKNESSQTRRYGVLFASKSKNKVIYCSVCDITINKKRWIYRDIYGFLLFLCGAVVPGLFYLWHSNPYICNKCGKRESLQYKKDSETVTIKSYTKKKFVIISLLWGIILLIVVLFKIIASSIAQN